MELRIGVLFLEFGCLQALLKCCQGMCFLNAYLHIDLEEIGFGITLATKFALFRVKSGCHPRSSFLSSLHLALMSF
jgi:hypothetical protein